VIIGARLGEREHRGDNLAVFGFALDEADTARLAEAQSQLREIPGDCGDEYRKPPFLTASGDLSHHLASLPRVFHATAGLARPGRTAVDSGSRWEPIAGYARPCGRAADPGQRHDGDPRREHHGVSGDAEGQTVYVLDKIGAAIEALGGELDDVVRTRSTRDAKCAEAVARVHGRYCAVRRPTRSWRSPGRSAATKSRSKPRRRSP
jgi:hypothetical protein